jgi:hypothetical protein
MCSRHAHSLLENILLKNAIITVNERTSVYKNRSRELAPLINIIYAVNTSKLSLAKNESIVCWNDF